MIYLDDLLDATQGTIHQQVVATQFDSFGFDSRQLKPGQLFMAVRTATGDGHDYLTEAIQKGATGIVCEQPNPDLPGQVTTIVVKNSQQALTDYATYILKKYRPKIIGVTGSNGKTTTKEAIAAILKRYYKVFKNYGSYNGRYGLPIALGELEADHKIAVLEMASDSFGEISYLVKMAPPDVGVVTAVNRTHLARLGTLDNVAMEKGRLIEALPFTGAAILNADDPRVAGMVPRTQGRILTFGLKPGADVRASDIKLDPKGMYFKLHYNGKTYQGHTPLLGRHQIYPVLAAITTSLIFEIPPESALVALERLKRIPGRMNPLPGRNGTLILDDTFNASPEATMAAIDTLVELPGATKVAILGDMSELGSEENSAHRQIGEFVSTRVDRLITKGGAAQEIAEAASLGTLGKRAVRVTFTSEDAVSQVEDLLSPDTVVLVKGSAETRLEQVVDKLLAHPERDQRYLVRQEPGWQKNRYPQPDRPTWVEIDLGAIANNVRVLADIAAPAKIMTILKADAYGHGMDKVARTVLNNGASWVGVATLGEAIKLREIGIDAPILVLSYMPAWQAHEAVYHNIRATVFSMEIAQAYSQAAQDVNKQAYIHVKVDSGMGRLGLLPDEVLPFIQQVNQLPNMRIEGLYTHFATADETDLTFTQQQLARFQEVLTKLEAEGLRPSIVHAANTAATIRVPESRFDMVRPGIGIYGLQPSKEMGIPDGFKPALTFKSTIGQVKTLPPNSPIGYGSLYRTQGDETIAIIPVGYADGFRRTPNNWGEVLVKGQRAPLVGRVSMDQAAINVSHISNVRQGDEVVLIGEQGSATITAEEVADNLGTINYEVVSELLARIPRIS